MTAKKAQLNPLLKLVLDLGPLLLFFLANSRPALFLPLVSPILPADIASGEHIGIFVATAVFMVAVVLALAGPARRALHQAQAHHHLSVVRGRVARRTGGRQIVARDGVRFRLPSHR